MATQNRIQTIVAAQNVIRSRKMVTSEMVGQKHIFTVRGNGNVIDVVNKAGDAVPQAGTDVQLKKKIFNLVCNSQIAMKNDRNKEILKAAYVAEKAQNTEEAGRLFNDYLNKIQVSISVLAGSKLFDVISDGDEVKGTVQLIETDKGSILTLDPKSLSIKAAGYGADSTGVDLMELLGGIEDKDFSKKPVDEDILDEVAA